MFNLFKNKKDNSKELLILIKQMKHELQISNQFNYKILVLLDKMEKKK